MKRKLCVLLAFCLLMPIFTIVAESEDEMIEDMAQLSDMLQNPFDYIFIDVRSEKDFNLLHIVGFQNMPYDETDWGQFTADSKPIVLICQSGVKAANVQQILYEYEIVNVMRCSFGVDDYLHFAGESFQEGYSICVPCRLKELLENEKETNEQ